MSDSKKGKLIVIDGLDGSGKETQISLLLDYLKSKNVDAEKFSFPNYKEPSSILAKMYLNGEIGSLNEINAYAASSFYSVDRYVTWQKYIKKLYCEGKIILVDRYTTSNMIHQTVKQTPDKQQDFINWLEDFEYNKLGIAKPDLVLYLDMHPNTSRKLMSLRYNNDESKKDIHESNLQYLIECRKIATNLIDSLGWKKINCCDGENPLPINEIHQEICKIVEKFLSD